MSSAKAWYGFSVPEILLPDTFHSERSLPPNIFVTGDSVKTVPEERVIDGFCLWPTSIHPPSVSGGADETDASSRGVEVPELIEEPDLIACAHSSCSSSSS